MHLQSSLGEGDASEGRIDKCFCNQFSFIATDFSVLFSLSVSQEGGEKPDSTQVCKQPDLRFQTPATAMQSQQEVFVKRSGWGQSSA